MAAYSKATPGAPSGGTYLFGDVVTDSLGIVYQCVKGGVAAGSFGTIGDAVFAAGTAVLTTAGTAALADMTVETAVAATVSKVTNASSGIRRTILTLTDLAQAVVNGTEYQGTKLVTFPEGRILVLGVLSTLAQKTTSAILTTLNSGTGAVSLGSVTASATTLSATMVDLAPSTAFTSSATINVAGTAVSPVLAAAAQFNGTSTALAMFLNSAYATTTDVDADATQTWTGTIQITWVPLGDI